MGAEGEGEKERKRMNKQEDRQNPKASGSDKDLL